MRKKLISHEIPLSLIDNHQNNISDYMFVLLHKLIADDKYAQKAYDYQKTNGMVYLDNSCFELGVSLDDKLLYEYCDKLNPSVVILPDALGDAKTTLRRTFSFLDSYPYTANYGMAVAQGSTPDELISCYAEMRDYRNQYGNDIFMLGIPFVFRWAEKTPSIQAEARIELLDFMVRHRIIDTNRRHHLLGTWQAREFINYRDYNWIYSIDTSNPIMAAIDGHQYKDDGLDDKPQSTFDSVYYMEENDIDMDLLYYNVKTFRSIVNG